MMRTTKQTKSTDKKTRKKATAAKKVASKAAVTLRKGAGTANVNVKKATAKVKLSSPAKKSPILEAVHEAAQDLHSIGVIDKTTMREFDALCLPKVPSYTPSQIKAIRTKCNASQTVFARYINVTPSSLQKWEIGAKKPSSVAMKLLSLIEQKGLEILL